MPTLDWDNLQRNQQEYNARREFAVRKKGKVRKRPGTTFVGGVSPMKGLKPMSVSAKRERMETKNDLDAIIDRQIRKIKEKNHG